MYEKFVSEDTDKQQILGIQFRRNNNQISE